MAMRLARECGLCGVMLRIATRTRGAGGPPVPGDPIVCNECGGRLVYDNPKRLRSLTPWEFLQLDIDVRRAIDAARNAVLDRGKEMVTEKIDLLVACLALASVAEAYL